MPHVMPQVALHRIIMDGIKILKANPDVLDDVFQYYMCPEMNSDYGQSYIDKIKTWFTTTKIPVVQAWSMNAAAVPQITIRLATEQEDETKSAVGDHWGDGEDGNIGVGVFTVTMDVMLYGTKNTDEVLWLYYIVNYVLFKRKRQVEALGLQLHSFSATDYTRDNERSGENLWIRTIRFRTTVQNFWDSEPYLDIGEIEVGLQFESTAEDAEPLTAVIEIGED